MESKDFKEMIEMLQFSTQINQQMVKKLVDENVNLQRSITELQEEVNDLQIKVITMINTENVFDLKELTDRANKTKLDIFNIESEKEDEKLGLLDKEEVTEECIVTTTSDVIFRSKIKIKDLKEDYKKLFLGKKVGDIIEKTTNDRTDFIKILSIKSA